MDQEEEWMPGLGVWDKRKHTSDSNENQESEGNDRRNPDRKTFPRLERLFVQNPQNMQLKIIAATTASQRLPQLTKRPTKDEVEKAKVADVETQLSPGQQKAWRTRDSTGQKTCACSVCMIPELMTGRNSLLKEEHFFLDIHVLHPS